jgi:alkanesulfonate monooxygenase SsuD/methylene tetrahydromethanopterin reductase-like flavin-dependent oxidoreductase (luciferase family)
MGSGRHRSQGTPEQIAEDLFAFVELGVADFVFMFDSPGDRRSLELLATHVAPHVRDRGAEVLASAG